MYRAQQAEAPSRDLSWTMVWSSRLRHIASLSRRLSGQERCRFVSRSKGAAWRYSGAIEHNVVVHRRAGSRPFSAASDGPIEPGIGLGKTSTGLVGLEVDHDAIPKIIAGNEALLHKMAQSDMPETAQYRINVEAIARYRIKVCQENPNDPEKVEELIDCGQVEELVLQAEAEMEVLDMYLESRLWEKIHPNEVEIEWDPNPMDDQSHTSMPEKEDK